MSSPFESFTDLVSFVMWGEVPRTKQVALAVNGKDNTGVLKYRPEENENLREGILKDISVSSFKLNHIVNQKDVCAVFFLDRSARLAAEGLKAVKDRSVNKDSDLVIDCINPDFFMKTNACVDKMIQNSVYSAFHTSDNSLLRKLFYNLNNIGVLKNPENDSNKDELNERLNQILTRGTASELVAFIKNELIIRSDSDRQILATLKSDLEKKGLKPEDKIVIFDICSHSGNTMNAVIDAFMALGYKNLEPLVMYPDHKGNQGSTKKLLRYPEEISCYPYDSPGNTSMYLKKDPQSMQTQVRDPFDLEIMKQITYDNVTGFLDRYQP